MMNKKYIVILFLLMMSSAKSTEWVRNLFSSASPSQMSQLALGLIEDINKEKEVENLETLARMFNINQSLHPYEKATLMLTLENKKRELKALQDQEERLRGAMDQIRATYAKLDASQREQFEQLQDELAKLDSLKSELQEEKQSLQEKEAELISLKDKLKASTLESATDKDELAGLKSKYDLLDKEYRKEKLSYKEAQQSLATKEKEFAESLEALKKELALQGIIIEEFKATNTTLTSQNLSLSQELQKLQASYGSLQKAQGQIEKMFGNAGEAISQKIDECNKSNQKLQELQIKLDKIKNQGFKMIPLIAEIKKENQTYKIKQAELESEIQSLKKQLATAISQLEQEKDTHSQTQAAKQKIEKELGELKIQYNTLEQVNKLVQQANSDLQGKVTNLQSEVGTLQGTIQLLQATQKELERTNTELQALNGQVVPEKDNLMAQLTTLKSSYADLEKQLQEVKRQKDISDESHAMALVAATEPLRLAAQQQAEDFKQQIAQVQERLDQKEVEIKDLLEQSQLDKVERKRLEKEVRELKVAKLAIARAKMQFEREVQDNLSSLEKFYQLKVQAKETYIQSALKLGDEFVQENKQLKQQLESQSRMVKPENASMQALQTVAQTYEQLYKDADKSAGEYRREVSKILADQKKTFNDLGSSFEKERQNLKADITTLQNQLQDAQVAAMQNSSDMLASSGSYIEPSDVRVERLRDEFEEEKIKMQEAMETRIQSIVTEYEQTNKVLENQLEKLNSSLEKLTSTNTALQKELNEIQAELSIQEDVLQENTKQLQAQIATNSKLVEKNKILQGLNDGLHQDIDNAQKDFVKFRAGNASAMQQVQILKTENQELKEEAQKIEEQMAEERQRAEEAKKAFNDENESLKDKNEEFRKLLGIMSNTESIPEEVRKNIRVLLDRDSNLNDPEN